MTEKAEIADQELLERLAKWVVLRRLTAPAIIFLETHRPLSFVGSQALVAAGPIVSFFEPFLQGLVGTGYDHALYKQFTNIMEDRSNVERLIVAIERHNQEKTIRDKEEKRRLKEQKRRMKEQRKALRRARREALR